MHVIVAPVSLSRLVALLASAWAALAACASFGTIAFTAPSGSRIGAIPLDPAHLVVALAAAAAVLAAGWRRRDAAVAVAVAPLALLFLPWLPAPVPAAFLTFTGALTALVWIGVGGALCAIAFAGGGLTFFGLTPRAAARLAAAISAAVFALAAWGVSPVLPGGDEPHYLVITQSLLYDGDLQIENNHRRGDYRAYYAAELPPHSIRPGRNGAIYSIHAPGVPALVLPAFAVGGYRAVVVFLILLSAAGCALAWWLAYRSTGSMAAAWFGWAVVTASAPLVLESFTVFPDGPGAPVVLTGFWALLRPDGDERARGSWVPWLLHGLALATLPWMHTRFAVLAATLGGLVLVRIARTRNPLANATAFLLPPALSALAWLFFFAVLYGAPDPSAPYGPGAQNALGFLPDGIGGLFFDQGFGLFATAPVLAVAIAGFGRTRRLAIEYLVVSLPYLLTVATFAMWWAGTSGPARFLVPLLLPLAIPAAHAWQAWRSTAARVLMIALLAVSAWMTGVMAGASGGRLAYHTRNEAGPTAAPWVEWANQVVDLPAALPAFVPPPVQPDPGGRVSRAQAARSGFATTLVWLLCLGGAALAARSIFRRSPRLEVGIAASTAAVAAAAMLALSLAWRFQGTPPLTVTAAQMAMLRRLSQEHIVAIDPARLRRLSVDEALEMRIESPVAHARQLARLNRPLAVFPGVPAGAYEMSVQRAGGGDGWVMVGVGNDQFAIATEPMSAYAQGVRIVLPVDVRALIVRGDEAARDQLQSVELRPLTRPVRVTDSVARRAVRYGSSVFFFLDDRAYPEPSGFWVGGKRGTAVGVQLDRAAAAVALMLRNPGAANTISLASGAWHEDVTLAAGEERRIEVPLDAATGSAVLQIHSAGGFRPSEADPANRDTRLLGVYVRLLDR